MVNMLNIKPLQRKPSPRKRSPRLPKRSLKLPKQFTVEKLIVDRSFLSLDHLPYSLRQRNFVYGSQDSDQKNISESALDGNVPKFKEVLDSMGPNFKNWKDWTYYIDVKLTMVDINETSRDEDEQTLHSVDVYQDVPNDCEEKDEKDGEASQNFTLTLSFLHLIILARRSKIIKCLMSKLDINDNEWTKTLSINKYEMKQNIAEEDSWIFSANCLHLAAKFHPKTLHVLLSNLHDKSCIIEQTHPYGGISPLHVACFRIDSLSIR